MQLFESACRRVSEVLFTHVQHRSRLTSLFFIGLVEARVDVLVKQKRAFGRI